MKKDKHMKRLNKKITILATTGLLLVSPIYSQKNLRSMDSMVKQLWEETSCSDFNDKRMTLLTDLQYYFDRCDDFGNYLKCTDPSVESDLEKNSVLGFYKGALDKILAEIEQEKVEKGHIAVWQLYNMGYIVKTPDHCFGIDICHKYGEKLAPYMDFLCITHKHPDHYTDALNDAMKSLGKPVYSNFLENGFKIEDRGVLNPVGDIEIFCKRVHHGKDYNTVTTYQIDCGESSGNKVIFHAGDAYDHNELEKTKDIDLFIPHTTVGLHLGYASKKLEPKYVLLSHLLEMGHPAKYPGSNFYRIPYVDAIRKAMFLGQEGGMVPVWGEKIIF